MKHSFVNNQQNISKTNSRSDQARINGAKSQGPTSPEGKARSSQNSTRHGFTARRVVLDNESVEIYTMILDRYSTLFNPKDIVEHDLVQTMVNARWRIRRAEGMESATYNTARLEAQEELSGKFENIDPATEQSFTVCSMGRKAAPTVGFFNIQEDRFQRMFERSYKLLARHRGLKLSALPTPEELLAAEEGLPDNFVPAPAPEPPPPPPKPEPQPEPVPQPQPEPKQALTPKPAEKNTLEKGNEPNFIEQPLYYFDEKRQAIVVDTSILDGYFKNRKL